MTAEHLRFILESHSETAAFLRAAQDLTRAEIPKTSSCCSVWGVSLHSRNQAVASSCVGTVFGCWWQGVLHNRLHQ